MELLHGPQQNQTKNQPSQLKPAGCCEDSQSSGSNGNLSVHQYPLCLEALIFANSIDYLRPTGSVSVSRTLLGRLRSNELNLLDSTNTGSGRKADRFLLLVVTSPAWGWNKVLLMECYVMCLSRTPSVAALYPYRPTNYTHMQPS